MKLTPHDGREVVATTVVIAKAGDGLSQALAIEPVELHHGEEVFVVLKGRVGPIRYDPVMHDGRDTGTLVRKQTINAETVTLVEAELVAGVLEEQAEKIKQAEAEEAARKAALAAEEKERRQREKEAADGTQRITDAIDPEGEGGDVIPLGGKRKAKAAGDGEVLRMLDCDSCGGTGKRGRGKCGACKGAGKVPLIAAD